MIKLKSIFTLFAALAICAPSLLAAEEETPLAKEMTAMNKTLRTLKRQVGDTTKKTESVAMVDKMKANVAAALKYEPTITKDQPAADKPAFVEKFKKQLGELDKILDDLKAAINKGDADGVTQQFEKLSDIKEKGHKDFAPEE
jgi:hypothetical protein